MHKTLELKVAQKFKGIVCLVLEWPWKIRVGEIPSPSKYRVNYQRDKWIRSDSTDRQIASNTIFYHQNMTPKVENISEKQLLKL